MSCPVLRVASVPAGHVYVRHLAHPSRDDGVRRLPDPPVAGAPPGRWWPPPMLEAGWVRAHADRFDLFHLHFGFDERTPDQLLGLLDALRRAGRPLVLTVHDLRNPHHADPARHDAALDVLVPSADAVITLTDGAAAEIARRWARTARVIPHPHVVDPTRAAVPRPPRTGFTVGLQAKPRANHDAEGVARALVGPIAALPGARLSIDVVDEPPGRELAARLRPLAAHPSVRLRVGPRMSDTELWDHLAGLDAVVLPYRFGSHSGWLEACHDLGTAVLVPDLGHFAEQGPCLVYRRDPAGPDRGSLAEALRTAYHGPAAPKADAAVRVAQRIRIADEHATLYRALCAVPPARVTG